MSINLLHLKELMLYLLERKVRTVWYSDTDTQRNLSPVPLLNSEDRLSFTRENAITFTFSYYKHPENKLRN
jgi:hypothetical protein